MILYLPPDKNKLLEYEIDNISVYNIWTRSAKILTYTHMSNSISLAGKVEGHIMPSTPGG